MLIDAVSWYRTIMVTGILLACLSLAPAAARAQDTSRCGGSSEAMGAGTMPPGAAAFGMMAGVGFEVMAANDCVQENKIPQACEHYRRALATVDKMDPAAAAARRGSITAQMQKINCP